MLKFILPFQKRFLVFSLVLLLSQMATSQNLSPLQIGAYLPGFSHILDMSTAPKGIYIFNYNYIINADTYYDRNGNEFAEQLINGVPFGANAETSAYANATSIAYMSDFKILGARYQAAISPTYLSQDFKGTVTLGQQTPIDGNVSGIGDLAILPLGLSWNFNDKVDLGFLYTTYIPTGRYDSEADDNVGQGFWTHQFQIPTYFYFNDQTTALGIIPTLELNGKVVDADARIGNRFSLEYGVSHYVTPWLELELVNAHNWQISDDTGSAVWWQEEPFASVLYSRDQRHTLSVGVGVFPGVEWLNLRAKYITDYSAKQTFRVNAFSFSFVLIPSNIK